VENWIPRVIPRPVDGWLPAWASKELSGERSPLLLDDDDEDALEREY